MGDGEKRGWKERGDKSVRLDIHSPRNESPMKIEVGKLLQDLSAGAMMSFWQLPESGRT